MKQKKFPALFILLLFCLCFTRCGDALTANDAHHKKGLYTPDTKFNGLSNSDSAKYATAIKEIYDTLLLNAGFNGEILVAKNGHIVFESYQGYSNFVSRDTITQHTAFHLASVSKTFTGMAILRLCEQKKLSLDDSVQRFFPAFPYHGIKIKLLLSHRSGLPNYLYFMDSLFDKTKKMTNQDVLTAMINHKPPVSFAPDTHFNYSNTNFMLLALIIEKITGTAFPDYMKQTVFDPLGMTDTYIFSLKDTAKYIPTMSVTKFYPMDQYDCTYGDKNVYSTVRDLLLWDKALYEHAFITKASTDMAFTPQSHEKETMHNYGLAWRMIIDGGDTLIYHNGKWHGTNAVFARLVKDTATIIVIGNKTNENIYKAKSMFAVFTGKKDSVRTEE